MAGRRRPQCMVRLPSGHLPGTVSVRLRPAPIRRYTRISMPADQRERVRLPAGFRLGDWVVHPAQNRLVSPKRTRHLEPRAMDLLCALASRAGKVADKDLLIDEVWEGRYISEGTLSNTVAELRQALEDDARSPRFIETIPKRGYRLIVAVEPVGTTAAHAPARMVWLWTAIAAVAAGVAVIAFLVWSRAEPPPPQAVDLLPSVRVEPFADRTEQPELASLAPMATDWVVQGLVDTGLVRVIRGQSAGTAPLVVTGACYREGAACRCRADLARDDGTLLAALDPPPGREPGTVVEAVRQAVAGAVATCLDAHAHSQPLLSRPPPYDAWREFMAGSLLYDADTEAAVRHLERAVELDPEFFSARFRLAFTQRHLGLTAQAVATMAALSAERDRRTPFERLWLDVGEALFGRRWEEARGHLRSLQEILPDDPAVNNLAGNAALALNQAGASLQDFERIDPSALPPIYHEAAVIAGAVRNHAEALHRLGRFQEALAIVKKARAVLSPSPLLDAAEVSQLGALGDVSALRQLLDGPLPETPDGPDRGELLLLAARTLRAFGHRGPSIDFGSRAVDWWRAHESNTPGASSVAQAFAYAERWQEAESILGDGLARRPNDLSLLGWQMVVASRRGDATAARRFETSIASLDGTAAGGRPTFWRAVASGERGDAAKAAELLDQACREGWGLWSYVLDSMLLEPVRDAPAVREALRPRG